MTIVASNNITVSNVNDGTITHTAYANSADGTDGFTTVYPNLNLLNFKSDFTFGKYLDWTTGMIGPNNVQRGIFDYIPVIPNAKYTFSANWTNGSAFGLFGFNSKTDSSATTIFSQVSNAWIPLSTSGQQITKNTTITIPNGINFIRMSWFSSGTLTLQSLLAAKPKVEPGSTATPWMPSSSEVTTADWPSFIGQYTDFTQADSTNPSDYTWSLIRGNDGKDGANGKDGIAGKDGVGIKTTVITYAISTSGTTAPTTGWTSSVPSLVKGQYLWTKTVWTYTDSSSETGYSVTYISKDGSNGDPGKVVSDTEPTTKFKGLTWKYSGSADMTASDGTVIHPNTEYYYNGTHWVINYFSVNNFAAESITSDKIDGKNLTISDGEFVSTTTNGQVTTSTEIKDNHIAISKTDGNLNTKNDIALDSEQGLAQKFTNIGTGFYRTAGINYQGPFTSDSDGNYAQLTPQGTKLSTDVPWTKLSLMNNFTGNIEYAIINGTVYISASGVGVPTMTAGQWEQAAQLPTGSSAIPVRANRIAAGDSGDGLSWALLSNQAGGIFIRCSANKAATANLFNATLPYPIG